MRPAATGATRTRVTRTIRADPTSTALLLAGPAAVDLWPGVRRVGEAGGRILVETGLRHVVATAATVRALPPQRTPTSYVTRFTFSGPALPETDGELTLDYASGSSVPATSAVLTLDSTGVEDSAVDPYDLTVMAQQFLGNLARAAEQRSNAA